MSLQANRLDGPPPGHCNELSPLGGAFFDHQHSDLGEPPYLKIDADDIDYDSDTVSEDDKAGGDSPPMSDALFGRGRCGGLRTRPRSGSRRPKKGGRYFNGGSAIIEIASSTRSHSKHREHRGKKTYGSM
jgi:hypothetical protein